MDGAGARGVPALFLARKVTVESKTAYLRVLILANVYHNLMHGTILTLLKTLCSNPIRPQYVGKAGRGGRPEQRGI